MIRALVVVAAAVLALGSSQAPSSKPIQLLFVGHDSRHHDSNRYAPILKEAIAADGITLTYTTDPNDLNPDKLRAYDALMIYANHSKITPEKAPLLRSLCVSRERR